MKQLKSKLGLFGLLLFALVTMSSCNEVVPAGYVGMVKTTSGIQEEVLQPGHHTCWGRDEMYLLETLESTETIKLDILCKDELNFAFDVKVRSKVNYGNAKDLKAILNGQGSKIKDGVLSYETLFKIYVEPIVDATSRATVSKYSTMQISTNRDKIRKTIFEEVQKQLKGTPMTVTSINLSNFDYPDVVTKAMEAKKKREIDIETEKANQALEVLQIKNREIIADLEITVKAKEAKAEAIYIKIIEGALNKNYLTLKDIQARKALYNRVGKGDKVIVDSEVAPLLNIK
jgi:hypothetical protein